MSRLQANCPSCAAPVKFRIGTSLVAVCEYCHTVVARGDKRVEDLGKVADLVDTQSPLQLGLKGKHDGKAFEIVGRCQFAHEAGGVWDEWYCAFNNKRWGWLAEAQGRFYLTFEWEPPAGLRFPEKSVLQIGRRIQLPEQPKLTVAEVGTAKAAGAEGEMPFLLQPGESHSYVDLAGEEGAFGTFDYGQNPPIAYLGREVTLDELGIGDVRAPEKEAKAVAAIGVSCPNCGGALELRAPDQTQRVVCPYCNSMLDATEGSLTYLSTLQVAPRTPLIDLGRKGTLDGVEYTVLGFLSRSVTYDAVDYYWDEYLLYQPRVGFRWLVNSDDHWSFVQPISVGEIHVDVRTLTWKGKTFKLFQQAVARVRYVVGEFYWKVTLDETVHASDYIHPPEMISVEDSVRFFETEGETAAERNVSLGTYLPHTEVERAFGVKDLPRSSKVAPNQPFPASWIYRDAAAAMGVLFLVGMIFVGISQSREVYRTSLQVPPRSQLPGLAPPVEAPAPAGQPAPAQPAQPGQPAPVRPPLNNGMLTTSNVTADAAVYFSEKPLEIHSRQPIQVTVNTSLQNSWVHVEGDLFNEETGTVQSFEIPVEYYAGYEDGEHWTEGSRSNSAVVSALPGGKYTLRLEVQTGSAAPEAVTVIVEEGKFRLLNFLLAMLAVLVIPIATAVRHYLFDRARWADSAYNPHWQGESSDED